MCSSIDPGFTISAWIARGGQSNAKLLIEGLRKAAGLPNEPALVRADEVIE